MKIVSRNSTGTDAGHHCPIRFIAGLILTKVGIAKGALPAQVITVVSFDF